MNKSSLQPSRMEIVRHEMFTDLTVHIQKLMVNNYSMDSDSGEQVGMSVVDFLTSHWAGITIVIPKDYKFRLARRDLEIYQGHRGNFTETALRWGLTERGARKVIERVSKRIAKQNEGRLSEGLDPSSDDGIPPEDTE